MELDINYEYEIQKRNKIMSRAPKLTIEERTWLMTHRTYNHKFGFPFLSKDIIKLSSNKTYNISVTMLSKNYKSYIHPIFSVAAKPGYIIYGDREVEDRKGNMSIGKKIRSLCLEIRENLYNTDFIFNAELGLLEVVYVVSYFDEKSRIYQTTTSGILANLSMLREDVSDNEVIYKCKNPLSDDFDAMIFSVKWEVLDD